MLSSAKGVKHNVYNIGNPEEIEIIRLAEIILELTKSGSEIRFIKELESEPRRRKPDITRIKNEINWMPTISLRKGLSGIIPYYKEQLEIKEIRGETNFSKN